MKQSLRVFGALSDENRVRMLLALRHGELCVCQLIELMDLSPSTRSISTSCDLLIFSSLTTPAAIATDAA